MTRNTAKAVAAAALVPLLALSGCGGGTATKKATPTATAPTGNVQVPPGVHLTAPGADLAFGKKAVVAYETTDNRSTVLELSVTAVRQGSIADLSAYTLDDRVRASVPYYAQVTVTNVGRGDIGNTAIPLFGISKDNTLLQASGFTNTFAPCPSKPLPQSFAPADTVHACLVFLVPNHGQLTGVSYRPQQKFAPIQWHGPITTPAPAPAPKPKAKPKG